MHEYVHHERLAACFVPAKRDAQIACRVPCFMVSARHCSPQHSGHAHVGLEGQWLLGVFAWLTTGIAKHLQSVCLMNSQRRERL